VATNSRAISGRHIRATKIQEAIKEGRKVPVLNNVGLAELVLTGSWYIYGENGGALSMELLPKTLTVQLCPSPP